MSLPIPVKPGDLTVAWVSDALEQHVESVDVEDLGAGKGILATVLRVHLRGRGLPETLVAKLPSPHADNYNVSVAYGFYRREVEFYRHVAGHLDVGTARCRYADVDDDGTNFVLLLDEVTGVTQPDQINGLTLAEADRVLDSVAALHAHWWMNPALERLHWLPAFDFPPYRAVQAQMLQVFPVFEELWGDKVAPEGLATARRQIHHVDHLMERWRTTKPATFAHYDLRGDNFLFAPDGALTLLDWQLCLRAPAAIDLAYLLGTNLTVDDRRAHEQGLLARYHARLETLGVRGYSLQQLQDDYRECMLNATNMAIMAAVLDPGNDRGRALIEAYVTRAMQASADLGIGEFLPDD